jgi:arylsulfotransferase ASST
MTYGKIISTTCRLLAAPAAAALVILGSASPSQSQQLCGTVPYPSSTQTPAQILTGPNVWSFVSEPTLHPMKVTINTLDPATDQGYVALAPYSFSADATYGQAGALLLDNNGNPVWFRPTGNINLMNTDFRVQHFNGKPVLTFWQGTLATPPTYTNAPGGSSEPGSCFYIMDNTYRVIKTVTAQYGFTPDIHEFLLTPSNTALFLSTKAVPMNLTPYGGPANGYVQDFAIQEIDLNTGRLVFFWDALNYIPLTNSYEPASSATQSGNVWDVYHLNSIGLTDSPTDIVVSGRNLWTIYRINKPTGQIVWQLGGMQSNFTFGSGATFSWQHDARYLPNNIVSMFDDNCCESQTVPPGTPPSHALFLQLDLVNKTANLTTQYFLDANLHVSSQGNVQTLSDGHVFVGWGQSAYYSEFAPGGNTITNPSMNLLYKATMPGSNYSYRAYRETWVGTPYYSPVIAAVQGHGQTTIYASWNGATEVKTWQVFAVNGAGVFPVATAAKSGFETAITVPGPGGYFQAKALDSHGTVIGVSGITLSR